MTQEEIQKYRESLQQHLVKSGHRDPALQDEFVRMIEGELADFVKQRCGVDFDSIYELLDKRLLDGLKSKSPIKEEFRRENENTGGVLQQALNVYLAFISSKWHPLRAKAKKQLGKGEKPVVKEPIIANEAETKYEKRESTIERILVEGAIQQEREREVHKRNPKLRELCIKAYGSRYECVVCGMNFVDVYGEIGKEFIEVHHLYPISETDGEHEVDPAAEMIPLCSNCHSMIHRLDDASDWKQLREMFLQKKG